MEAKININELYLTIKQAYFDQIIAGTKTKEFREVRPSTIKRLLLLDENGNEMTDEYGNSQPIPYKTIRFRVGMQKEADNVPYSRWARWKASGVPPEHLANEATM